MSILKHNKTIGSATVISNDLIPKGSANPNRKLQAINSITLHNTGCVDVKANNFHRSLKRENALTNGRQASWHFTVDDKEIYQEVDTAYETWHSGTSTGNKNSISIEMCMWSDKEKQRKTYANAAKLVAELMTIHNISIDNIKQHYHWSKKNCPQYLRENKHGFNWNWFINLIKVELGQANLQEVKNDSYRVKITADVLNVRTGPGTSYKVATTVKKNEVYTIVESINNWGRLKSGAGYISLAYTTKL